MSEKIVSYLLPFDESSKKVWLKAESPFDSPSEDSWSIIRPTLGYGMINAEQVMLSNIQEASLDSSGKMRVTENDWINDETGNNIKELLCIVPVNTKNELITVEHDEFTFYKPFPIETVLNIMKESVVPPKFIEEVQKLAQ